MSSQFGKVEADTEIKAEAHLFHDVFSCRPHHVSNISPHNIQGCDLHEGEWGKVGTVVVWNYTHDGIPKVAKEVIEAIDNENLSVTFKVIEGDLMQEFKSFIATIKATPKPDGKGTKVHWTFEYEKLHDKIVDPHTLLEFALDISRDIDAHLVSQA